ncbi:antibiotic biosynthesis monooxygenase [Streptomyces sp. IMTB 2501]|uniref:putative quinol monooxygenase n=1 Tax=Streptomyces sp. IMTB 2501 TaxID=1776340 RepID=UPI00096CA0FC|nr:antibiotic biosynthesis monooxygenase [Streptomyces sp. IMTB 2501]OLZ62321.1 antibiotic biosynthesis monooxygenase [Streptomyces sp. IMTB 2501]
MAFAVVAQYQCAPADADTVRDALRKMRELVPSEPANLAYEAHEVVDRPGAFVLYERYTDRAGFEAHKETGHFAELIRGTVFPLLEERTITMAETL